MSALSLSNGTPQVASIVTSICIACIAELKRPTDSTKRRARVKYTSGNTAQHAATLLPALTEDLARQGCGEVQISYDEEDSLTVRWPASLDDKVAVACSSWLHAHYQCHATWECPHMAATQLQRLDAACRANAYNCVPDWDDNASETLSLLLHVIGGKPGQRGASGMPYVYSLKWQPYNENNPRGRGQVSFCHLGQGVCARLACVLLKCVFCTHNNAAGTFGPILLGLNLLTDVHGHRITHNAAFNTNGRTKASHKLSLLWCIQCDPRWRLFLLMVLVCF